MTPPDDFPGDMEAFPFDDHDSDAVFGAAAGTPDVPDSLRDVTDLVHAARRSASADELVGEDVMVAAIAGAITGKVTALPRRGADERTPVFSKFRTAKLVAAATVTLMVGGTAAAAATGSLPTPAPTRHQAELASSHEATPVVDSEPSESEHHGDRVFGTVESVNGVSDSGTCGVADADGTFTVKDRDDETWTVNVAADTEFSVKHSSDPSSFANVCVDSRVKAKGTLEDATLTATEVKIKDPSVHEIKHRKHERRGAFGQVASVNGVSDPGTCGAADTAGTFTVTGFKGDTFTVNVDPSTAYAAKDVTDASFANVCVGLLAFAKGDVTDTTVTATSVFILPPKTDDGDDDGDHHGVFGEVTSVNGVSDEDTCGTEGADGSFTIVDRDGNTVTVNVTSATQFFGKDHSWNHGDDSWNDDNESSSFADVCVGEKAGAKGEQTDAVLAAEMVFVFGDHHWGDFRRHDGDKHDCNGRHGDWRGDNDGKRWGDHDNDASFTSHRGDDDHDGGDWGGKGRHGGWSGHDRDGDNGGWGHHGGHDDD